MKSKIQLENRGPAVDILYLALGLVLSCACAIGGYLTLVALGVF